MNSEDKIAAMKCLDGYSTHVRHGFQMAQMEARLIAKEADDLMAEMAESMGLMLETGFNQDMERALEKYNAWKERTQ